MHQSLHYSPAVTRCLSIVLVLISVFLASASYAAFVPVAQSENSSKQVAPEKMRETALQLAFMSNKEIEVITGKKMTLKEKAGLYFLRRQITKKDNRYFRDLIRDKDGCFTMYLKNGDVIEVKLIQISTTEIKYQRCNKPGDPEIVIAKADVFSIKDSEGESIYSSKDESWKKGYADRDGETDRLALASGITGIAALTLGLFIWPIGLAAGITAGIMGIISMRRFRTNRNLRGEGWAITGITAGGLWVFFGILILIALASGW